MIFAAYGAAVASPMKLAAARPRLLLSLSDPSDALSTPHLVFPVTVLSSGGCLYCRVCLPPAPGLPVAVSPERIIVRSPLAAMVRLWCETAKNDRLRYHDNNDRIPAVLLPTAALPSLLVL